MTCVPWASPPSRPCRTSASIAARKAASVLPEPVGAAMRVWRPALIAGHASACAGVGEAKVSANQFATAGWNRVSTPVGGRAAELSPASVRAFEIEAKSECKRLGSPRARRKCVRLYIWRRIGLWSPLRRSLAESGDLGQGLTPAPARFKRSAAFRQLAPPNWESIYDKSNPADP